MRLVSLLLMTPSVFPLLALAADPDPTPVPDTIEQLRQELQSEQEHIKLLEGRLAQVEAAQAASGSGAQASPTAALASASDTLQGNFGPEGFVLQAVDGANSIHLRGNVSVDGRFYSDVYTPSSDDTWLIRRLRPTLEGTLADHFDYRIMPDFAQGKTILQDAWADARVEPWLVLQFGKFKAPVGLERLQLEQFGRFIETALTADLLPYRDLGVRSAVSWIRARSPMTSASSMALPMAAARTAMACPIRTPRASSPGTRGCSQCPFCIRIWEACRE
jgi:phosphate-selective porin OprO and OprP